MNLGDTSFSDIFSGFVNKLPDLAAGYAQYSLAKEQIDLQKTAMTRPAANVSPYLPYSYSPQYSPAYGGQIPAPVSQSNNTMIYLALGGAALLLFLGTRKG